MTHMLCEVHQQPGIIRQLAGLESPSVAALAGEIRQRRVRSVITAARGTSHHAAVYAKYLLEIGCGLPVAAAEPSVFTLYNARLDLEDVLVLGISQSGEALDVTECLLQARERGALTAAITNHPGSRITRAADFTLNCHAEPEISLAATKTYTSSLAVLYLLSAELRDESEGRSQLFRAADRMDEVLALEPEIASLARDFEGMERCFVIARGINLCTALETGLKMVESCYIAAQAYSAASFMHGPVAAVSEGSICFAFAPEGEALSAMRDAIRKLGDKRARTVVFSSDESVLSGAGEVVAMPAGVEEALSPLVYITAAQLFVNYLAEAKGCDPDHPHGLTKVILTR